MRIANPYITVDWLPIDLTVFNGQSNPPMDDGNRQCSGCERSRGSAARHDRGHGPIRDPAARVPRTPAATGRNDLWTAVSEQFGPDAHYRTSVGHAAGRHFTQIKNLDHTLGYVNYAFHDPASLAPWSSWTMRTPTGPAYRGSPSKPYPWLTWSNSPYISQFQLMQVPASSPSRLGWEYSTYDTTQIFYNEQTDRRIADSDGNGEGTHFRCLARRLDIC